MKELKEMIRDYWFIDKIKDGYWNQILNYGRFAAIRDLYFYAKETAAYKEFKGYTKNQIFRNFLELMY